MIELNDELRLIRHQVRDQETWICQQRCPENTWKNRPLWKPITAPLNADALAAWLARNALSTPAGLHTSGLLA
ncbi:hypothetical protein [Motiliproteus sediminis]|uniref:hypothetical protein n=1 Tax=Motiliproteus sediminis TaxID=1468178 RepID=UPI001AF02123|nr:hypothetical protein [Motiliproteus sediminis]